MRRRVVVTGMGMVTPVGHDREATWRSLTAGKSGVGPITLFDASTFPTRIAAEVQGFDPARVVPDANAVRDAGRNVWFALAAAKQAYDEAGLADATDIDRERFGVYLGAGEGQPDFLPFMRLIGQTYQPAQKQVATDEFIRRGLTQLHNRRELQQEPSMPTKYVAKLVGAHGPNFNCLTACAASSQAIGEAAYLIRRGDADVMLAGGSHSMIHPLGVTGFCLLTALSQRNDNPQGASRPFDRDRDGFVMGEGAGMLVLEELEHARRRGASIFGEVLGYGVTADAFRMTDVHPDGRGAIAAMKAAVRDAGKNDDEIDYINAHGTSTPANDSTETLAIKKAFGDVAGNIPVSSTKSMMGHLVAAGGAVEAIVCLLTLRDGVVPPTINLDHPDDDCDLDYVPHQPRERRVKTVLSNNFGFGGQNTTLVFGAFAG